jgi:hypothetical protein
MNEQEDGSTGMGKVSHVVPAPRPCEAPLP